MTDQQEPQRVNLTSDEAEALKKRLKNSDLPKKDIDLLLGLIAFNTWLQARLARAKVTIKKLRQVFGFKNESKKKNKKPKDKTPASSDDQSQETEANDVVVPSNSDFGSDNEPSNQAALSTPKWDPDKNHGRLGHRDYPGCPEIDVPIENETLKRGYCPACAQHNTVAKVLPEAPKVVVLLHSQPMVMGYRYNLERVRCNTCKEYHTAEPTEQMKGRTKYDISCKTSIAIHHYYAGQPFNRIEMLQKAQGIPLPDATQFDLMEQLYQLAIEPVFLELRRCAAQGSGLFFDDSPGRILEQMAANKLAQKRSDKKSVHTTAILSEYEGRRIYLFQTNTLTAGKQLATLLSERTSTEPFTTMSDASPHNFPALEENLSARWIITLCLSHGRRKFVELLGDTDDDIQHVVDLIAQVYQNEAHCKQYKLNDADRLIYHQTHSTPVIDSLHSWLNNLFLYKHIEPNSQFGEAVNYMLKRWYWLTQFLRVPGAALDNNLCEQAIKVAIRYRKNSLFYRTFHGADIGDAMMSVLHTCAHNQVNLFDYLNILQQHTEKIKAAPESWLPWNYQQTLESLTLAVDQAV